MIHDGSMSQDKTRVKTSVKPSCGKVLTMDNAKRAAGRLLLLAQQIKGERKPRTNKDLAGLLGISADILSHITAGRRGAGLKTIEDVVRTTGVSRRWFYEPALASEDYHDYLGGQPATTYELDSAEGIHEVESYLADLEAMGADVDPEHAAALREFRPSAYQPDREMVMKVYKDIVRLSRGKTPERPDLEPHKLRPGRVKLGGDGEG